MRARDCIQLSLVTLQAHALSTLDTQHSAYCMLTQANWPLSASEPAGASAAAIPAARGEPAERSPRGVKPTTKHRGGAELLCGLWCAAGPPAPPSGGRRGYQSLSVRLAPRRPSQGGVARR